MRLTENAGLGNNEWSRCNARMYERVLVEIVVF